MKRDLKPFVVEVKRGTRRSSFLGHLDQSSPTSEAQRRAEAALFAPVLAEVAAKAQSGGEASRRILPSLIEPPPPPPVVEEDYYGPHPRPRPVGRPRKPKPPLIEAAPYRAPSSIAVAARPTQARPVIHPQSEVVAPSTGLASGGAAPSAAHPQVETPAPTASRPDASDAASVNGARQRLRDRSSIIARYVLGTEPAPGQRWNRSSGRAERRGRLSE